MALSQSQIHCQTLSKLHQSQLLPPLFRHDCLNEYMLLRSICCRRSANLIRLNKLFEVSCNMCCVLGIYLVHRLHLCLKLASEFVQLVVVEADFDLPMFLEVKVARCMSVWAQLRAFECCYLFEWALQMMVLEMSM
jgi:hypothetical protein